MIIENINYKRNKYGNITKRQKVRIICDECGSEWESLMEYRNMKRSDIDLCIICRSKHRFDNGKIDMPSHLIACDYCGKEFQQFYSHSNIRKHNYCSKDCHNSSYLKRYEHLYKSFNKNPNELAYLCGLILGDGNLRKQARQTTKICISFDIKHQNLLDFACDILYKLEIDFSIAPTIQSNCQKINFAVPDKLLQTYNMLWSGNKFDNQPVPIDDIIHNPNFIGGLINSDGNVNRGNSGHESLRFVNTCKSIIDSFKKSLHINNIEFNEYSYNPTIHPQTRNMQKQSYIIVIGKTKYVKHLREQCMVRK